MTKKRRKSAGHGSAGHELEPYSATVRRIARMIAAERPADAHRLEEIADELESIERLLERFGLRDDS